MLHIQNFLRTVENGLEMLAAPPFNLKITYKDNFVMFKYNQIDSDFNEPICREARGLILEMGTWKVMRMAFKKFFNLGDVYADKIDWATATASLKLDGSLISLWYDGEEWRWSTNGTLDARDAPLENGCFKTFQDLIDKALENYDIDYNSLNTNYVYTMELCSRYNKVVIDYPEIALWHTVTVDRTTLKEVECDIGIPKPPIYICETKADYQKLVDAFESDKEGIVVKDADGKRVKIKTPLYFKLHKKANNGKITVAAALQIILDNEQSEFLTYFPELEPYFKKVGMQYEDMFSILNNIQLEVDYWQKQNPFAGRKQFAEYVKETSDSVRHPNYYFLAYDNKLQAKLDSIANNAEKLVKFLKLEVDI